MKTTMKKLPLSAALAAALSATAPAQAEDSLYVPYEFLSAQIRKEINADLDRSNEQLRLQISKEAQAATAATVANEQSGNREGAFWL